MFKKYFVLALAASMLCAVCAMPVAAQSGRVRQLSYAKRIKADTSKPLSIIESSSQLKTDARPNLATGNTRAGKLSPLVYNNNARNQADKSSDGNYHMTKGDRIAGYAILGYVILTGIIWIIHDGDF